ncbi:hypothetical protein C5167_009407 [Papaver somniferum]|uniref:Glycosyltransferase 61 catalytic domain-containing protein n=1 Tax=Papaver somniferum TaxID=3469 RepID=A0A4Y7K1A0_PAPSO|nr:EGF domain-specific O-linked N-acetylglucosamine transferase-like [Papaver somniferum]RZC65719.1 hypothetical protein C5167_009407 [Papaver somniferum]
MGNLNKDYQWRISVLMSAAVFLILLPLIYVVFGSNSSLANTTRMNKILNWSNGRNNKSLSNHQFVEEVQGDPATDLLVRRLVRGRDLIKLDATGFSCDLSVNSDVCVSKEPIRIDMRSMTVYLSPKQSLPSMNWTLRPYANKQASETMSFIRKVEILRGIEDKPPPPCDVTHNVSAVIFSTGAFSGNVFHEFSEVIIPLFLTTYHFRSQLQFVAVDYEAWWVSKYNHILTHLSNYNVMDSVKDGKVHCFPGAVMGLKYHDKLACNTSEIPGGYSAKNFTKFIRDSFSLKINHVMEIENPVLMIISRKRTRVLLNENEIVALATELGFRVITVAPDQMSNLNVLSHQINSCSVLLGVHGAGLTNELFLPERAVMLQVVPLGLEWASAAYYSDPAKQMGLTYLEYKINPEESSLLEKYGKYHPVITDPAAIHKQGYLALRAVYIDGQNVTVNLSRFRGTLVQATKLIRRSTP